MIDLLIGLENFNAIGLASSGMLDSSLVHHLVGHEILHSLFSAVRRKKGRGLSRSQRRKMINRRRRRFTDNIIMHHKRIHDKNRQIVIASARSKSASSRLLRKKDHLERRGLSPKDMPNESTKWRDYVDLRDRGAKIRGRVDARKLRARSRWLSAQES